MTITFSKLDIKKNETLRKEVDEVLKLTSPSPPSSPSSVVAPQLTNSFLNSLVSEISIVEDFISNNEQDDRIVLFSKQLLRLRQGVAKCNSHVVVTDKVASHPSSGSSVKSPKGIINKSNNNNITPIKSVGFSTKSPIGSNVTPKTTPQQRSPSQTMGSSNSKKNRSASKADLLNASFASTAKVSPLYTWEQPPRKRTPTYALPISVSLPGHGVFTPTVNRGFYIKSGDNNEDDDITEDRKPDLPNTHLDLTIVLSPENYQQLLKRRRQKRSDIAHVKRFENVTNGSSDGKGGNMENSLFLNSSSPFIDKRDVVNSLYRSG